MLLAILNFVEFLWLLVFIGFNIVLNLYLIFQCKNTLMNKYLNLLLWFIFVVRYIMDEVAARNIMVLIARGGMRINGMHGGIGC